jgi:Kef-type K+ transport system membrane component KefB
MKKVLLFSVLLVVGLIISQHIDRFTGDSAVISDLVRILTMVMLGFIMIHVGYEFEIDRSKIRNYGFDYLVAATSAAFPWILCAAYFVFFLYEPSQWKSFDVWTGALLAGRFAAPTSAGVLFSMLIATGLSATWFFRKVRILAIFDDLDTVLLMIPLKMLIVGVRWQLGVIVGIMIIQLWFAWRYLHKIRIPISWPWVLGYATAIAIVSEIIYKVSKLLDEVVPIHIEVLLPAFVIGCIIARSTGHDTHSNDARDGHQDSLESPQEQKVATIISAAFMVLVGLSMPPIELGAKSWMWIAPHVLAITALANLGKMFPLFVYRKEAHWKERLAICISMWPRGEVGAGVLIVSLGYGIGGQMITVAALSLALNLLLTGVFIAVVKSLLGSTPPRREKTLYVEKPANT